MQFVPKGQIAPGESPSKKAWSLPQGQGQMSFRHTHITATMMQLLEPTSKGLRLDT